MTKRSTLKILHWLAFGLIGYFFLVEPHVSERVPDNLKTAALATHAGMGMILALVSFLWLVLWPKGPTGRAGPKLPAMAKRVHRFLNVGIFWILPLMVLSGALAGLLANYPVLGFGVIPLNPTGWGNATVHGLAEEIHEVLFNVTLAFIVAHAGFHLWRHFWVKDNALRIITPIVLHKYL